MTDDAQIVGNESDQLDHVLKAGDSDFWDIEDTLKNGTEVKIRTKELTTRDGLLLNQLQLNIMKRLGVSKKRNFDEDTKIMMLVQHYPMIRYGTEATIGLAVPQTEEAFWLIPERIMLIWSESVLEANPQYAIPFTTVRQMLDRLLQQNSEE
jgi:hypothetical protein